MRRRDQLLGVGAGLAVLGLEPRLRAVRLILERAGERGECAGARRALAVPDGRAGALECHGCFSSARRIPRVAREWSSLARPERGDADVKQARVLGHEVRGWGPRAADFG